MDKDSVKNYQFTDEKSRNKKKLWYKEQLLR